MIVLGVKVIIFSPSILSFFKSDFENKKSPCKMPEIFSFASSPKAIESLFANSALWFFLMSPVV